MNTAERIAFTLVALAVQSLTFAQPAVIPPTNQTACLNGPASFRVRVSSGTSPYTYSWQHDGVPIDPDANATAATALLTISNAALSDAGQYRAVVTDATGSTTSDSATLVVDPTLTKITQGPVVEDRQPTGGVAWGDYDGDCRLDLFVANGSTDRNSFYRNVGGDEFVRITNALTAALPQPTWGAQWADVDNDGDPDLFILHPFSAQGFPANLARNRMFRNDGGGVFTPMANAITAVDGLWTEASWVDHDGDGWLDLFATTQSFAASQSLDDFFFHNLRDGTFAAWTTNEVGVVVAPQSKTAGPAWCDIDGDGDLDLYVSNFGGTTNFLYRNEGGRMELATAGSLPARRPTWAAVWADFNNDGLFDLFTGGENGTNTLHLNRGNWIFEDVTVASGLELAGTVYTAAVGDYDNDSDVDLYVPVYNATDVFYANRGDATFDRVSVGSPLTEGFQNGAMWVDYNNDGFLDLFEPCGDGTPALNLLYRNSLPEHGNANHWLKIKLKGTVSNANAIGARVWVRGVIGGKETWQLRQLTTSCYVTAPTDGLRVHFGLGDATTVDLLRIEWPSGNVQELENVAPNQMLTVTESVGITPVRPSASLNGSVTLARSPLSGAAYQWRFEGVDLPGQTNRTLVLTNLVAGDAGRYSVVSTSGADSATNHTYVQVDTQFAETTEEPEVTDLGCSFGSAWGDYDRDGDVDLLVGRYSVGLTQLYENQDAIGFAAVSGLFPEGTDSWFSPILADFDNDSWPDLFVARASKAAHLLFNENGQSFTLVESISTYPWNVSAADYNRDGLLDLYFTSSASARNRLLQNLGGRAFQEMTTGETGDLIAYGTFGGACWADYDDDGWVDVYAPHLSGNRQFLFRNQGGRFLQVQDAIPETGLRPLAGAWGDYDNDEDLDLVVACFGGESVVYRNLGAGKFELAQVGVTITGEYNSASWADYDNDGHLDLFMTWGNAQMNALFRNNGNGTFTRITTGSLVTDRAIDNAASYNGLWFDANNDGFLDLYVSNGNDAATARTANYFYRNTPNGNHWLQVRLVGTTSNPQGIGAKVRARASIGGRVPWQRRDITAGDASNGNQLCAHFGLGDATNVMTLRIEWPSGTVQELTDVAANQMLTILEPHRPVMNGAFGPDGSFQIEVTTENGLNYELQASEDLGSWTTAETYTGTGEVIRLAPIAPAEQHRFYRVVSP